MRVIIPVVLIVVFAVLVFAWISTRRTRQQFDSHDLSRAQELIDTIRDRSIEMASIGDPFAQTILDDIRQYERAKRKELQ